MLAPHTETNFPAKLYTPEGELLAEGESSVLPADRAVNFTSDFVPLYPIGTQLVIERIFNGHTVHRFFGQVFLSSKTHMRLTSAEDVLLPGAEYLYCGKMAFPATLTALNVPTSGPRLPFLRKNQAAAVSYPALIVEMTDRFLECQLDLQPEDSDHFATDQMFTLNTLGSIPLAPTTVCVEQSYLFGDLSSCVLRFDHLEEDARATLKQFLIGHMQRHYKLF